MARTADWAEQPGHLLIRRAFQLATADGRSCWPVHLLTALAERDDAIGQALAPLRPSPDPAVSKLGGVSSYVFGQLQGAATEFAAARGEPVDAPHLLIALLDQGDPEASDALTNAGIDRTALRRVALHELGAPSDLGPIGVPAMTPAGTLDRPPLAVTELDPRGWRVLTWRQEHLPLNRIRHLWQAEALGSLEQRTAWRVADRLGVDDDQRYSLLALHHDEIERLIAGVLPEYADRYRSLRADGALRLERLRRRRRRLPNFMVGWPTWFANRRVGLRNRWFALTSRAAYRGQPPL